MNHYDWLISRLDAFIRKYYANQLIRGSLVLLSCLLFYILTVSVGEYYLYLPVWLKVSLVSLFVVLGICALVVWVIIPLSKMARLGKVISHEQAATIIGRHFPEISDKLLNILQLRRQADTHVSRELLEASIDQKAAQISVVPINSAIDLSRNRKYLPYLLPLVLIGIIIMVIAPNVFTEASERLLQPTRTFEKPAPFRFVVLNSKMQAVRNTDFVLKVKAEGDALPAEMSVDMGTDRVVMQVLEKNTFQYTFRNVTEPVNFRLFAAGFYSQPYNIKVAQKPILKAFKIEIDYPEYTGKKDEVQSSLGDITVPAGTYVRWAFVAEHTDEVTLRFGSGNNVKLPKQANIFASQFRFFNDTAYTLTLYNKQNAVADSYRYQVKVIPDQYPVIQLQEHRDTVSGKQILLNGTVGDDYSITRVLFHYQVLSAQNQVLSSKNIPLKASQGALTTFQHYFDVHVLNLQPGQKLNYFIEAWDNDGVRGSKASRSEVMSYFMYTPKQLDSAINENAEQISSGLSNSSEQTKQLQSEYKEMQSKMLQGDKSEWQQQQSMMELGKMQDQLKAQMEAVKKRFEEQVQQSQQKQYSEDIKEKQDELKKQMDNLLNKELAEQMKKLQDLMNQLNKDQAFQTMKQLEQENKLFNMDLQRMQELMKKLEMQMKLEDMAGKMEELAKKEEQLKEQTDKGGKDAQALKKEQEAIRKELEKEMSEGMKEMKEINKEMKRPEDVSDNEQQGKDAQEEMQKSEEQLQENQKSKASESQKKAADNLKKMAKSMKSKAGGMNAKQIEIDIKATRQILTNLMRMSFDQEQLMKKVQATSRSSQTFLANQQEQSRLYGNSRMIKDSLFALSKRIFDLKETVNKETMELESNMSAATDAIEARRVGDAVTRQQYVMTHTNNLALMLNELLSNLLQQQAQAQPASGEGSPGSPKPGSKPSPGAGKQLSDIITKQQELGNAMQQMENAKQQRQGGKQQGQQGQGQQGTEGQQGKEGQQPGQEGQQGQQGGKQGGQSGGEGSTESEYGDAEQLARMAQQQAAIRRQLQELNRMLNSKGMGNAKELKEIQDKMDRTETDLVNKRTSGELLMRQKEILTRLLQAEKSLREQEQDDKRSSKSAQEISRPMPAELQKYLKDRERLLELYKTVPPQLKPYYKTMVEQYYRMIGTN
ncbi:MAG: hypothetical protein EOP56_11995 [Sphingobacteriales bacterium]|nr:MAG: hypothetical protein EOP56_11995 [Sphingobacteriales bacterium]